MKQKKLQVFVSSTYKDLIEERQTAVLSILSSGHIPAGMELFTAGDESQWNVNDALEKKIKKEGSSVLETSKAQEFKAFKELVLSKMVKFFSDEKDIKLAVYETMADFSNRKELIGWVRSNNSINSEQVAQQLSTLSQENSILREKLSSVNSQPTVNEQLYNGLRLNEIIDVLSSADIPKSKVSDKQAELLNKYRKKLELKSNSLLVFLIAYLKMLSKNKVDYYNDFQNKCCKELKALGLVDSKGRDGSYYGFTEEGRKLYLKLLVKYSSILN